MEIRICSEKVKEQVVVKFSSNDSYSGFFLYALLCIPWFVTSLRQQVTFTSVLVNFCCNVECTQ